MAYVSRRVVAHFLIYIHLYFTKEMVVVKTHTINKQKNTISKHKVNMTVISLVKNITIKL